MAYTGTLEAFALGILTDDGFEISYQPKGQDINDTDQYGMTLLEGIYRGQDWKCRFRGKEFAKVGLLTALGLFGTQNTNASPAPAITGPGNANPIGVTYSSRAQVLILTVVPNTPAATNDAPTSLTASLAILAANTNISLLFTSKLREVPLEMNLLPYTASTYTVPFTVS